MLQSTLSLILFTRRRSEGKERKGGGGARGPDLLDSKGTRNFDCDRTSQDSKDLIFLEFLVWTSGSRNIPLVSISLELLIENGYGPNVLGTERLLYFWIQ